MRNLVRNSFKGGCCSAFNQYCKSIISDVVFNNISEKLGVIVNVCDIPDKFFEYTNKHRKRIGN